MKRLFFFGIFLNTSLQAMDAISSANLILAIKSTAQKKVITFDHFKNAVETSIQNCSKIQNTEERFKAWKSQYNQLWHLLPDDKQSLDVLLHKAQEQLYDNYVFNFLVHIKRTQVQPTNTSWLSWDTLQPQPVELQSLKKITPATKEDFETFVKKAATTYGLILPYTEFAKNVWTTEEVPIRKIHLYNEIIKDKEGHIKQFNMLAEKLSSCDLHCLCLLPKINNLQLQSLKGYQLSQLPIEICNLTWLQALVLGNNNLTTLPENITALQQLKILAINFNKFKNLPEMIKKLPLLERLAANNNELQEDPGEIIAELKNLKYLDLSENKLSSIKNLHPALVYLRLAKNKLTEIPSLKACKELKYATFDGNPFDADKFPYNDLMHLPKVKKFSDHQGRMLTIEKN